MSVKSVSAAIRSMTASGPVNAESFARVVAATGKLQDRDELRAIENLAASMNSGVVSFDKSGRDAILKQIKKGDQVSKAVDANAAKPGTEANKYAHRAKLAKQATWGGLLPGPGLGYALVYFPALANPLTLALALAGTLTMMGGMAVEAHAEGKLGDANEAFRASLPD